MASKTIASLLSYLDGIAPFDTAESFDNCGLLIGSADQSAKKIGVALDVTPTVLQAAIAEGVTVLLTHHPVIFDPLKSISTESMPYQLIKHGMACIATHTNLDRAVGGVNDCLATALGLKDPHKPEALGGFAAMGQRPIEEVATFVTAIKAAFSLQALRYYDSGRPVQQVVSIAGSGGGFLETAVALGADTVVTGDLKHDRFIAAQVLGVNLIELPHHESESVVLAPLVKSLQQAGFSAVLLSERVIVTG